MTEFTLKSKSHLQLADGARVVRSYPVRPRAGQPVIRLCVHCGKPVDKPWNERRSCARNLSCADPLCLPASSRVLIF